MINVEIIKVYAGQILPCGQVTGNKEFTIGGVRLVCMFLGCDMPIQLVLSSEYDDRLIDWKIVSSCTDSRPELQNI